MSPDYACSFLSLHTVFPLYFTVFAIACMSAETYKYMRIRPLEGQGIVAGAPILSLLLCVLQDLPLSLRLSLANLKTVFDN
jgi:hypothetical protein